MYIGPEYTPALLALGIGFGIWMARLGFYWVHLAIMQRRYGRFSKNSGPDLEPGGEQSPQSTAVTLAELSERMKATSERLDQILERSNALRDQQQE